jgi:glycosyltransferase-like protein
VSTRPFKIALLTHSTNPRGGVVHCLELADALTRQGHSVTLHAPGVPGQSLFRTSLCRVQIVPSRAGSGNLRQVVQTRIDDFKAWFSEPGRANFDVFHAHDGIGANALLALRQQGVVPGYVRTVHHVDDGFGDTVVDALEERSIRQADRLVCVSPSWVDKIRSRFQREAVHVYNGVDVSRFSARPGALDAALARRLGLGQGPVFLMVGGIEARKNTVAALTAFLRLRQQVPDAQLLIAGGASLLDHGPYRQQFDHVLATAGLVVGPGQAVVLAGVLPDAEMPALYRQATALLFPSVLEGFGLAIVEAMASGVPVIVSNMAPFTDFLAADDCLWVDPLAVESMAQGMLGALCKGTAHALSARGPQVARRFDWNHCATAHATIYADLALASVSIS